MTSTEELYAKDLACQALGIVLGEVSPGRASLLMRVTSSMVNGHGIAHGGYLFLLADAAFAFACNSYGPVTVAQSAQITYQRPVRAGDELSALAAERGRFGLHGIYDVTVRLAGGAVVAEFRGHSVVLAGNRSLATMED